MDSTFGTGGKAVGAFPSNNAAISSLALQPDGKIIAAGQDGSNFALARYNVSGRLDASFGLSGEIVTSFGSPPYVEAGALAVKVELNGDIVAAGPAGSTFALTRYNPNGALDPTFGTSGKVNTIFYQDGRAVSSELWAIALQADGNMVAAGSAGDGGFPATQGFALARYITGVAGGRGSVRSDFNGDIFADYLLFDATTRQTAVWYLQRNAFSTGAYGPTLPFGWTVVCAADVDLDGQPDYVIFNSSTRQTGIWFLNNTVFTGGSLGPILPVSWRVVAATDVNRDGRPDYVLFNASTRQTAVWFLNNTMLTGAAYGPTLPAGWTLADSNDFNGDGKPDFVLFNPSTRQTAIWYLNGTALAGAGYGPTVSAGWTLQGSADFNRDGKPDYVLFNGSTRQTAIWYLNGATFTSGAFGPTLAAGYSLVSP